MNNTLRDALIHALNQPRYADDAMGVLHFVRGWLQVQPKEVRDTELAAAIKAFTDTQPAEQKN